jgi:hypothetical protein
MDEWVPGWYLSMIQTLLVDRGALLKLIGRSVTNIYYHSATCLGLFWLYSRFGLVPKCWISSFERCCSVLAVNACRGRVLQRWHIGLKSLLLCGAWKCGESLVLTTFLIFLTRRQETWKLPTWVQLQMHNWLNNSRRLDVRSINNWSGRCLIIFKLAGKHPETLTRHSLPLWKMPLIMWTKGYTLARGASCKVSYAMTHRNTYFAAGSSILQDVTLGLPDV